MAENVLFRWLHISDLHVFDTTEMDLILKSYKVLAKRFQPDFLVVTGDYRHLARKNSTFDTGLRYLNKIVTIFGLEKKNVYLVPGNHDVNHYCRRDKHISAIRAELETNGDAYASKKEKLLKGFRAYKAFVQKFYEDAPLSPDDPRIRRPAETVSLLWKDEKHEGIGVNLILFNTALLSGKESQLDQIGDIRELGRVEVNKTYPTLVLAHHGIQRMPATHQELMTAILDHLHARAYLCGDSHRVGGHNRPRGSDPNKNILQFTCGKSAPEPGDNYSDLTAIGYECRSDGKAYVQVYRYTKTREDGIRSFQDATDLRLPDGSPTYIPMFTPLSSYSSRQEDDLFERVAEDDYDSPWKIVGRKKEIRGLMERLKQDKTKMLWVTGVAGLGKTELCKEVGRRMRKAYNGWSMPYVKLADVNSYASFLTALARALGGRLSDQQDRWENDIRRLLQLHEDNWGLPMPLVLYFDNFEDVVDSEKTDREKIYCLLLELSQRYHLLFSTQKLPNTPRMVDADLVFPLKLLSWEGEGLDNRAFLRLESAKLFRRIWGRKPGNETEWEHFRTLITEIQGHPLAIVLTAHMARNDILGLNYVVDHWPQASQDIPREGERHISLDKSLQLAWNGVKDHPAAVRYWSLQYYSILPIPMYLHSKLEIGFTAGELQEGIRALSQYHLLTKEGSGISMLSPIRKQFPELLADPSALEKGLLIWTKALLTLLEEAEAWGSDRRDAAHLEVLPLMPQLLHVLEKLADLGEAQLPLLRSLAYAAGYYYQYYMPSADTLTKLLSLPVTKTDSSLYAFLHMRSGGLQSRLGEPDKAMELYEQAEALFRKVQDDLGLAYTLRSMGDLQSRLGQPKKAMELYEQAEALYQKEHDDLGLACTLRSMGDLQRRLGQPEKVMELYERAEGLYRKVQDDLGLANALRSMGDLQRLLGQPKKAMKLYEQAEALYRKEQSDLGLANTLQSMGDLQSRLGQPGKAMELYEQAKGLYRKEQHGLGLAYTLRSMGYLQYLLGQPEKAMGLYEQAEGLFRKEQHDLGLANTLQSMGDLQRRLGEPEKAMELYKQAEGLYRKEQDDLGLANTLQSMGDLQRLSGEPEKAMELYEQAEKLYRKEQDDLGLANALQSMGYLQYLLGESEKAMELYEQAEALYKKEQHGLGLANTLRSMGDLQCLLGEPGKAMGLYEQAEGLYRKEQVPMGLVNVLLEQARLHIKKGKKQAAREKAKEALGLSEPMHYSYGINEAKRILKMRRWTLGSARRLLTI